MVFENKVEAMQIFKKYKDARFKSFKNYAEALKFAKNETNPAATKFLENLLKCKYHSK